MLAKDSLSKGHGFRSGQGHDSSAVSVHCLGQFSYYHSLIVNQSVISSAHPFSLVCYGHVTRVKDQI